MRGWLSGFILMIFIGGAGFAFAADPVVVKIPCDQDPFPTCSALKALLLDGGGANGILGFHASVRDVMDDVYSGKTKVEAVSGGTACTTLNPVGKPPLCPPLKVSENGCVDEFLKNAKGETCAPISKVGEITTEKYYYTLGKASSGSLETANIAGGLLVAISNQAADIEKEIATNSLTLEPTSPCYSQALALNQLIARQSDVRLLERVKTCDVTGTDTCSTKNYFNSDLATIESAYLLLARCRLSDESTTKFRAFALDYPTRIEDVVVKDCFQANVGNPAGMRACYASKYKTWIQRRARDAFPNVAASCQN
jgi:hypothetical protein